MTQHDDGGHAFARNGQCDIDDGTRWIEEQNGMTLLAFYAGMALAGMRASHVEIKSVDAARIAFQDAEAMIAEMRRREAAP